MSVYDGVATRALKTITAKGAEVTFPGAAVGGTEPTYDPLTDTWSGGSAGAAATGRAVQIDGDPDRLKALNLTLVNPVTLMIAAKNLGVTPVPGKSMTWAGKTYSLVDIQDVGPDGVPIIYVVTGTAGSA